MAFNSRQYEWNDITVVMGGRVVTGLRAISYTEKQEKEAVYGKGNKAQSIQRGNKEYSGEIGLLQSEYETLKTVAGGSLMDISLDIVASYGNPTKGDMIKTTILKGVEFTEDKTDWKQGDKFTEKTLPFVFLDKKEV